VTVQPSPATHIRDEIRFKRPQSMAIRALLVLPGALCSLLMVLIVVGWLAGRFTSDRYAWSQWLLWIPTPAALIACALNILLAFRATIWPRDPRMRAFLWSLATVGIAVYFMLVEHHMLRRAPTLADTGHTLRIVHWNMGPDTATDVPNCVAAVNRLGGDITFISDPGSIQQQGLVKSQLSPDMDVPTLGTLAVFTKLPILAFRPLLASDGMLAAFVQIDTTATLGRPLTVYLIDMPSDLRKPRLELARKFRAMLDEAKPPLPDLVVGDFNLTRGSASLKTMFPLLRHAYDQAGHGYAATFHGEFPLWHIDQMLLGPNLRALDYQVRNTHYGRHWAQVAEIAPINPTK
jgi:hypothetical protein